MLFFYIRHGDPIYQPDSLTPLGEYQAEAVKSRLGQFGLDKIYASTHHDKTNQLKTKIRLVQLSFVCRGERIHL